MATDTVQIAGKPVNKKVLYVGGAVAIGAVGYAWYTSSAGGIGTAEEEPEPELPKPVPEPTDEPGFDVIGGGPRPTTNADWNAKAIQALQNIGIDVVAAQAAIGKFLQRRPLNTVEASLVEQAIAAAGYPPENPPWIIIREVAQDKPPTPKPGPGPVKPPPPKPVPTTRPTPPTRVIATAIGGGKARIVWSGATGGPGSYYEIRSRGVVGVWKRVNTPYYTTLARWRPRTRLAFEVRTRNAKGTSAGRVSNTIVIR